MSAARDLLDYFDAPAGYSFNLPPATALDFFTAKGLKPTFSYLDMLGEEHVASFTVAKMLDTDLLAQVHQSLTDAMTSGTPFKQWADTIVPTLQAKGWWGRQAVVDPLTGQTVTAQLGSPHRLKTIFRTNVQSAYAVGAWEQIDAQKTDAPFLLYDAVDDHRTRPEHAVHDNKVLPIDDRFWRVWYPPNGYNCRCSAIQLSQDDLDDLGLEVSASEPVKTENWTNPRTGKVEKVPVGQDPGFGYNVGAVRLEQLAKLALEKAAALPPQLAAQAAKGLQATKLATQAATDVNVPGAPAPRAVMRSANLAAQREIDDALKAATPYLATAIKQLQAGKKSLTPPELLAQAQAMAAKAKAQAQITGWKKAYLADKPASPSQQAAFDALPDEAQAALYKTLDDQKAAIAADKAAAQQLEQIAAGSSGAMEAKTYAKLTTTDAWGKLSNTEKVQAVLTSAAQQKAAISQGAGAANYKKALIAGKIPTAGQKAAFDSLSPEKQAKILAEVEAAKTKPQPASSTATPGLIDQPAVTINPQALAKIGPQEGSNEGGLYQDINTGVAWYVKWMPEERLRNEVLASKLYQAAGVEAPDLRIIELDGRRAIASRIIEGLAIDRNALTSARVPGAYEGFAADAWLADWDVVGLKFDNLKVGNGRAVRIDVGGALRFRAQGTQKGAAFGDVVGELESLRNPGTNPQASQVFAGVTDADIEDGVRRILAIPDQRIADLVDEFGPLDARERTRLLATLLARRQYLAERYPNARPKAPKPQNDERVTAAEQQAILASRVNGYTMLTDKDEIEDHHVVVMTYKDGQGKQRTRAALKLTPNARLAGADEDFKLDTTTFANAVEALVRGVNRQHREGGTIREKDLSRLKEVRSAYRSFVDQLRNAEARGTLTGKYKTQADVLHNVTLEALRRIEVAFSTVKVDAPAFNMGIWDFDLMRLDVTLPSPAGGIEWRKSTGFAYQRGTIVRGNMREGQWQETIPLVSSVLSTDVDNVTVKYITQSDSNPFATRGYMQLDTDGAGVDATQKLLDALEKVGINNQRPSDQDLLEIYLDKHLHLYRIKDSVLDADIRKLAAEQDQGERIAKKQTALNANAGYDVRKSPFWNPSPAPQTFNQGRALVQRADTSTPEWEELIKTTILYHNPDGLGVGTVGDESVMERLQLLVRSGGQLASQMDRVRRGGTLKGSSVKSDLNTGGGNYVFTRLQERKAAANLSRKTGFWFNSKVMRRIDAVSYDFDHFGNTTEAAQRAKRLTRAAELADARKKRSNETIFKNAFDLWDVEAIVFDSDTSVAQAIAMMRTEGYNTWPDGRRLEDVIVQQARFRP